MIAELATQPGVDPHAVSRLLGARDWLTVIAEHHLETGLGVDLMGCVADPWAAGIPGGPPPEARTERVVLAWFEWDVVTRGSEAPPLWSLSCEPSLMGGAPVAPAAWEPTLRRLASAPVASRALRVARALPPQGNLLHAAPLGARRQEGLRLSTWCAIGAVPSLLQELGHPAVPADLRGLLFDLGASHHRVGIQLEALREGLGSYLAFESPLEWGHLPAPPVRLDAWLPVGGSPGRTRWEALGRWLRETAAHGPRTQRYLKLTAGPEGWQAKAYAGLTTVDPGGPSTAPSGPGC